MKLKIEVELDGVTSTELLQKQIRIMMRRLKHISNGSFDFKYEIQTNAKKINAIKK